MTSDAATPQASADSQGGGLAARVAADADALEREIGEIDLLINQARTEAGRHEQKRAAAAEKLTSMSAAGATPPADLADLNGQLVTLTRRATVMDAQVEVLEGKRKVLARYLEALRSFASELEGVAEGNGRTSLAAETGTPAPAVERPAVSRAVLAAQEDLRREIARAMHDGPAQSLTNIVLQAQVVERIVAKDPEVARGEVRQLVSMVQQTLEATKSFIFDVRPMVLDDLGLVPTMRRAARDRGRRAGVPVEFETLGADRRLSMELESVLFRMLDEALAGYLSIAPARVSIRLDWGDQLEAVIAASRDANAPESAATPAPELDGTDGEPGSRGRLFRGKDKEPEALPPALAAMMEDRTAERLAAAEAARLASIAAMPPTAWREIQARASTIGATAELLAEGGELRIVVDLSSAEAPPST